MADGVCNQLLLNKFSDLSSCFMRKNESDLSKGDNKVSSESITFKKGKVGY